MPNPFFERYIGIDYSGAETADSSLKGIQAFQADWVSPPRPVPPPPGPRKHWTRRGLAEWLAVILSEARPTLVGIDHAFSFPLPYFKKHRLKLDWPEFLDDFQRHWPTDAPNRYVSSVQSGCGGQGEKRQGDATWLRLTEQWTPSAKSVFQFRVQGQVATATHAGLPWLRHLRGCCGERLHCWPFDGWQIPQGRSVVAEVYPSLWMRRFPRDERDGDQQAAYAVAAWLQRADLHQFLPVYLDPPLEKTEQVQADIEGWILGVV